MNNRTLSVAVVTLFISGALVIGHVARSFIDPFDLIITFVVGALFIFLFAILASIVETYMEVANEES